MKYSTLFLLLIILQYNLFGQNEYHTFSGYVLDEAGYSTLACLTFTGLDRTVCCNSEGFFRIDSIPTGTHDLQISSLGYSRIKTKITIREDMKRKFTMFPAIAYYNIKQTEEFEDYHEKLEESAGDLPVMEFVIDSLKEDRGTLYFYSTFRNNSDYPIYILEEKECVRPFKFEVFNSSGDMVERNMVTLDCDVGGPYNPDKKDLVEMAPRSEYKYPATSFWLYNFKHFPKDEYSISICYEYEEPMKIRVWRKNSIDVYKSDIYAARIGLRGKYRSQNVVKYKN